MYKKICPNCKRASFSASRIKGSDECPHCGRDLGDVDIVDNKQKESE